MAGLEEGVREKEVELGGGVGPAEGREGEEGRGEPRVQDVLVLGERQRRRREFGEGGLGFGEGFGLVAAAEPVAAVGVLEGMGQLNEGKRRKKKQKKT